jgi:hypothetical protein
MTLKHHFFLITALVVLAFAAIAWGPGFKQTVKPVKAATNPNPPPPPAYAIMTCSSIVGTSSAVNGTVATPGVLSQPVVDNVDFTLGLNLSNFGAFQTGQDCSTALQALVEDGFSKGAEPQTVFAGSFSAGYPVTGSVLYTQYVYKMN